LSFSISETPKNEIPIFTYIPLYIFREKVSTVNQREALLEGEYGQTSGAFYGNPLKLISALQADLLHLSLMS
jgi:hypothetical protein